MKELNRNQLTSPTKFSKILLAVDNSPHSLATVKPVAALALASGAQVLVLHVWNDHIHSEVGYLHGESHQEARTLVDTVATLLATHGVIATSRLDAASPEAVPQTIVANAKLYKADLIAVGSRGSSDLKALLFGSVSLRVLHDSDCPVLIVRANQANPAHENMLRLLVAVSDQEDADMAVSTVMAIAQGNAADILVVHVPYLLTSEGVVWIEATSQSGKIVNNVVHRLKEAGIKATGVVTGPSSLIAPNITEISHNWNADLIIMGSRRPSRLRAIFSNNVDHSVIHDANLPVLVTHRTEEHDKEERDTHA